MRYQIYNSVRERAIAKLASLRILNRYTVVAPDGSPVSDASSEMVIEALGEGGFGVVVRARDDLEIDRAVKFFFPQVVRVTGETTSYRREILLTNRAPFKHVIRIMDYGMSKDARGQDYGVYVMDFVDGMSLVKFSRKYLVANRSGILDDLGLRDWAYDTLFALLTQLVEAVTELHSVDIVHMDVKPKNTLVQLGEYRDPERLLRVRPDLTLFLTDLGGAKKVPAGRSGETPLICSAPYFPMHLQTELGYNETRQTVRYERLRQYREGIDLYCIARTMEELLLDRHYRQRSEHLWPALPSRRDESQKERFWRELLGQEFEVLKLIIDDILATVGRGEVQSSAHLRRTLSKVSLRSSADALASPVLTDRYPPLRMRVGRELVHLAKPLDRVVNHQMFQRLKNLHQLGYVYEIFPGATHSRFSHSVLTFNLAKQYVRSLGRESVFRFLFGPRDIDSILCAALLHDLGQYSFAHSIEDLRKVGDRVKGYEFLQSIRYDQELLTEFLRRPDREGMTIAGILGDLDVSPEQLEALTTKERREPRSAQMAIARDILTGTIDVDRISYLTLDSHMTGIPYGEGIDVDSLIESLVVRFEGGMGSVGVDERGLSAAEMVLAAVYWMYRNVYWHHANRGFMAMIKHVFSTLMEAGLLGFEEYIERTVHLTDREALEFLSSKWNVFRADSGVHYPNPMEMLLEGHRFGYRRIASVGDVRGQEGELYGELIGLSSRQAYQQVREAVAEALGRSSLAEADPEVLIDVGLKPRLHDRIGPNGEAVAATAADVEAGVELWVKRRHKGAGGGIAWQRIQELSGLTREISKEEGRQGRKVRVYASRMLLEQLPTRGLDRAVLQERILDAVEGALTGVQREGTTMGLSGSSEPE